jgi:hypothetical protein
MTGIMPSADQAMLRPPQTRPTSVLVWLGLTAYLALVKVGITLFPAVFRSAAQAAVFDWPFLAIWGLGGLVGISFARKTGFPDAWDEGRPRRQYADALRDDDQEEKRATVDTARENGRGQRQL